MSESLMRTFLAVELPKEVRDRLKQIQDRLRATLKGIRWVRPEGMHLTLKFFGDVSAADIARIEKTVKTRTDTAASMTFSLGVPGAFPNTTRPRVLWLGIEGDTDRLVTLQQCIEADLDNEGFPKEKRSFKPHLTLGRVKSPGGKVGEIDAAMKDMNGPAQHHFYVDELTLFRSDLKPTGAVYTKLARFPFGG